MENGWKKQIIRLSFVIMSVLVAVGGFISAFSTRQNELDENTGVVFALICVCSGALFVVHNMENKRIKKLARIYIAAAIILFGVFGFSFLEYSFFGLVNDLNIGITYNNSVSAAGFILYVTVLLCVLESELMYRKNTSLSVLVSFIILVVPCFFERMPSSVYVTLFIIFAAGFFSTPKKNDNKVYWQIPLETMAVTAIICIVVMMVFPQRNFKQWGIFDSVRSYIMRSFEKEEIQEEHVMTNGGMNGGTIGNIDEISYSYKTMLTLKTGTKGGVYLKGFAGAVFNNNQWRDLSNDEYVTEKNDYKEMFEAFEADHFNTSLQTAHLFQAVENSEDTYLMVADSLNSYLGKVLRRKNTVYYENDDSEFAFVPYGSLYSVQNKSSYDGYYINEKPAIEAYAYIFKANDYDFWKNMTDNYSGSNQKLLEYISWEKQYRDFVYDMYTSVSEEHKSAIDNAISEVPEYKPDGTLAGVNAYAQSVKKYFEDNYTYTLAPGRIPEGKDAVTYFMDETQEGYCTYFASAAAFIFRNAGIPCRYVEGYCTYVSENNVQNKEDAIDSRNSSTFSAKDSYTKYTVNITDADAHAWVEIYMDGYGWIPVDVTPGYKNKQNTELYAEIEQTSDIDIIRDETDGEKDGSNEADTDLDEEDSDTLVEPHVKDSYDTFAEYMRDNTTKRIDFKIVLPIMGRYILRVLRIVSIIACILAAAGLCFIIPWKFSNIKRKALYTFYEKKSDEENRKQIIAIYGNVEKLGRFLKCSRNADESYMEYAKRLSVLKEYFKEADVEAIVRVTLKASFSRDELNSEEIKNAIDAGVEINRKSYAELGRIKRLLYKYIWHLG